MSTISGLSNSYASWDSYTSRISQSNSQNTSAADQAKNLQKLFTQLDTNSDGSIVDILPALKDEDSHYWTAMPDHENILSRVHVALVPDTTDTTNPFSYSKPCDTVRP